MCHLVRLQFGVARKVTTTKNTTTIIVDAAARDEIQARIAHIKKELAEINSVYDSEKMAAELLSFLVELLL